MYIRLFNLAGEPMAGFASRYQGEPATALREEILSNLTRATNIQALGFNGTLYEQGDSRGKEYYGLFEWGPLLGIFQISGRLHHDTLPRFLPTSIADHCLGHFKGDYQ